MFYNYKDLASSNWSIVWEIIKIISIIIFWVVLSLTIIGGFVYFINQSEERERSIPSVKAIVTRITNDEVWVISENNKGGIQGLINIDASIKPLLDIGTIVLWKKDRGIQQVLVSSAMMNKNKITIKLKNKYAEILSEIKDPQARIRFEDALAKMLEEKEL